MIGNADSQVMSRVGDEEMKVEDNSNAVVTLREITKFVSSKKELLYALQFTGEYSLLSHSFSMI